MNLWWTSGTSSHHTIMSVPVLTVTWKYPTCTGGMLHYDVKCVPLHSLTNTEMGIEGVQRLAETLKVNRALEVIRYSVVHWEYIHRHVIQPHALVV